MNRHWRRAVWYSTATYGAVDASKTDDEIVERTRGWIPKALAYRCGSGASFNIQTNIAQGLSFYSYTESKYARNRNTEVDYKSVKDSR